MFEAYTFVGSIVHPIGASERIVTQKLLDVVTRVTQKELDSENLKSDEQPDRQLHKVQERI